MERGPPIRCGQISVKPAERARGLKELNNSIQGTCEADCVGGAIRGVIKVEIGRRFRHNLLLEFQRGVGGRGIYQRAVSRRAGNLRSRRVIVGPAVRSSGILLEQVELRQKVRTDSCAIVSSSCNGDEVGHRTSLVKLHGSGKCPSGQKRNNDGQRQAGHDEQWKHRRQKRRACCLLTGTWRNAAGF